MPRINRIAKGRVEHRCTGCGGTIKVGEPYTYIRKRYGGTIEHHDKCEWRPTQLSNAKTAVVEEAIEDARRAIENAESVSDIESAMQDCGEAARGVADEYQEAMDSWGGGNGATPPSDWEEKQQACSDFADECENWSADEDPDQAGEDAAEDLEREDGESDEDFETRKEEAAEDARNETLSTVRDSALETLDNFSF